MKHNSNSPRATNARNRASSKAAFKTFKPEELKEILDAAATLRKDLDKVIALCTLTGLRLTEAVTLSFADVDLQAKIINVPEGATKARRSRLVPIGDRCIQLLRYLKVRYEKPVPFDMETLKTDFVQASKKAGVAGTFHALRTTAYRWFKAVGSITAEAIDAVMGHSITSASQEADAPSDDTQAFEDIRAAQDKLTSLIDPQ